MFHKLIPDIWNLDTETFWVRRLHTLVLTGNGAALVLLGTLIRSDNNKSGIEQAQDQIEYFIPFFIGILFCAVASIFGALADQSNKGLEHSTAEHKNSSPLDKHTRNIFANQMVKFSDQRTKQRKLYAFHLFLGAVCFLYGLSYLSGVWENLANIVFSLQTYSH